MSNWINVTERLPIENGAYLVYRREGFAHGISLYVDGTWLVSKHFPVIYWMHLPPAPSKNGCDVSLVGEWLKHERTPIQNEDEVNSEH